MPIYSFPTNIQPGDIGQTTWANSISVALNALGPLVGNVPVFLAGTTPTTSTYIHFKSVGGNVLEIWIEDGA